MSEEMQVLKENDLTLINQNSSGFFSDSQLKLFPRRELEKH